jgi:hypothetical protein
MSDATKRAPSDAAEQAPSTANPSELEAREGKLTEERSKLQQSLQVETEPLRKQSLTEMICPTMRT